MTNFILLAHLASLFYLSQPMTIDKAIFASAPEATMYNFLHLMPGGEVNFLAEFDLLLSLEEYNELHDNSPKRDKRKAVRDDKYRWTGCIVYYEIDDSISDPRDINVIKEAMKHWSAYTCLVFKESHTASKRILFRDGGGCYSKLGMQSKGPQPISLARGCRTKGVVSHEIGHAIGFIHEHMRPDRDKYIKVNFPAIPPTYHSQYRLYNNSFIKTYDVPYDYTSLMHYGATVIPNSIETLDKSYQSKIGQRKGLSFKDIKTANLMYKCAKVMGCWERACPEEGFQLYKKLKGKPKCECWCDSGNIDDPLIHCDDPNRPKPTEPTTPATTTPKPTEKPVEPPPMECMDMHPDCHEFKERGQCMSEMELMMDVCAKTCDFCGKGKGMCMDHEKSCKLAAIAGLCKEPGFQPTMETLCPDSCGLCQKPPDPCEIMKEMMSPLQDPNNNNNGAVTRFASSQWGHGALRGLLPVLIVFAVSRVLGGTQG